MDKLRINFSALNADFDTPSFDFYARKQLLLSARLIAIAILSVCPSVRLSAVSYTHLTLPTNREV